MNELTWKLFLDCCFCRTSVLTCDQGQPEHCKAEEAVQEPGDEVCERRHGRFRRMMIAVRVAPVSLEFVVTGIKNKFGSNSANQRLWATQKVTVVDTEISLEWKTYNILTPVSMSQQRCVGDSKISKLFLLLSHLLYSQEDGGEGGVQLLDKNIRKKYEGKYQTWMPLSTAVLVMARLFDCGMKRKESEESSDLSCDTEKLVMKAQTPPESRVIIIIIITSDHYQLGQKLAPNLRKCGNEHSFCGAVN